MYNILTVCIYLLVSCAEYWMLLFVLTQDGVQPAELEDMHILPHAVKHKLSQVVSRIHNQLPELSW